MTSISTAHLPSPLISSSHPKPKRSLIAANAKPKAASSLEADAKPRPWWAPLFRTIIRESTGSDGEEAEEVVGEGKTGRSGRSGLTAEKARVLRRRMRATETWQDAMYHSAIASRLASADEY